jgi:ribosomal protein S18 acetylase RimI-like enzyme
MPEDGAQPHSSGRRDAAADDRPTPPGPTRPGTTADAGAAARLHAEQITQGFLSLLGPRFLERLYRRICLDPSSFVIVLEEGTTTGSSPAVGFVAGSTDVPGLYRSFLWRDGVAAALPALGHLVSHWRRVIETLRHGTSSDGSGTGRGAELLAIAVDHRFQGQGRGQTLVGAFLAEVARRHAHAAHVVVGADNRGAVALYERTGFVAVERFELHPGVESLLMQWEPAGSAPDPVQPPTPAP